MPNIVALGLDVSNFNDQKKQTLQEFIQLFNDLSKYDGKVIYPVLGEGITSLNSSLKETAALMDSMQKKMITLEETQKAYASSAIAGESALLKTILSAIEAQTAQTAAINASINAIAAEKKATDASAASARDARNATIAKTNAIVAEQKAVEKLTNDYAQLKAALKDKEVSYANAYINTGKNSATTKAALGDLQATRDVVNDIDKNLGNANGRAQLFGGSLTKAFSALRTIAYILPGIGIAGIFNLAFEAIEKAAESAGLFKDKVQEIIDLQSHLYDIEKQLNTVYTDRADIISGYSTFDINKVGNDIKDQKAAGDNYELQLSNIDKENDLRKKQADNRVKALNASYTELGELNLQTFKREDLLNKISQLEVKIQEKQDEKVPLHGFVQGVLTKEGALNGLKNTRDFYKSLLDEVEKGDDAVKKRYTDVQGALIEQVNANNAIQEEQLKRQKFYQDSRDKLASDSSNEERQTRIARAEIEKSDFAATQKTKLDALKTAYEQQVGIVRTNESLIVGDNSKSSFEQSDAVKKAQEEKKRLLLKYNEDVRKVNEDYAERAITAIHAINKDEIETSQKNNESIFKNEEKSLEDRLNALRSWQQDRRKAIEEDYNFQTEIARRNGKTPAELSAISSNRDKELDATNYEIPQKIYEITTSWGDKTLKAVLDDNKALESAYKDQYAEELNNLNRSFADKEISFEEYYGKRKRLQHTFALDQAHQQILDDRESIHHLTNARDDINPKIDDAQAELDAANSTGDSKAIENAKSKYDALIKERQKYDDEIHKANEKLNADNAKYADAEYQKRIEGQRKLEQLIGQIQEEAFNFAKTLIDAGTEYRLEKLRYETEEVDKLYTQQSASVQNSTLSVKDKAALEIRLAEEKREYDRQQYLEERSIKRNEAVADKDLSIAKAIWNTAGAVTKTLEVYGATPIGFELAAAVGVLGALQIASIIATPIPAFAEGGIMNKDGYALYGEAGSELVKEPNRKPYIVDRATVGKVRKGTEFIPMALVPDIGIKSADDSWAQTRFLAKEMKKNTKQIKNQVIVKNVINYDFEAYKHKIIHG